MASVHEREKLTIQISRFEEPLSSPPPLSSPLSASNMCVTVQQTALQLEADHDILWHACVEGADSLLQKWWQIIGAVRASLNNFV